MISANGSAAKYQAETALNEAVEEEEEPGDDAPHVNGHVSGELEDTGTLADDEAEVTDIRKEEDQGETKEVVGTPQPVNEESEEKADEGKEEENEERPKENAADDDVRLSKIYHISKMKFFKHDSTKLILYNKPDLTIDPGGTNV